MPKTRKDWVAEHLPKEIDENNYQGGVWGCPGNEIYDGMPGERPDHNKKCSGFEDKKCTECWNTPLPPDPNRQIKIEKIATNQAAYNEKFGERLAAIDTILSSSNWDPYDDEEIDTAYKIMNVLFGTEEATQSKKEMVDHPDHYHVHENECIDEIQAMLTPEEFKGFLKGNFLKYRYRTGHKDDAEQEGKKSDWYMNKLMEVDGWK